MMYYSTGAFLLVFNTLKIRGFLRMKIDDLLDGGIESIIRTQ